MPAEQSARGVSGQSKPESARAPDLLSGAEAIARVERVLVGTALARDPAIAEGLALAGVRAASLSEGGALCASRSPGSLDGVSCVHHVCAAPLEVSLGAFELAASSAQQAVDHCLAAHLLSQRLGQPGSCSMTPGLAADLSLVELPEEGIAAALKVAADDGAGELPTLAAEALRSVSERTGRANDILGRAGDAQPEIALVAAGADVAIADELATLLRGAGTTTAVLSLVLVRPLPRNRVREALAGAGSVWLLHAPDHPSALLEELRGAAPEPAEVRALPCSTPAQAIEALRRAGVVDAKALRAADPAPLRRRLIVTPDGPWARQLLRRVLAKLTGADPLRLDRRSSSQLGAAVLAWDGGDGLPLEQDLLLAPEPAALRGDGALQLMRPGGSVLLLGQASSTQRLARQLSRDVREALVERDIRLYWTPPDADGSSAADTLCRAARVLVTSPGDVGENSPVRAVSAAELSSASAVEEVDFRPATALPRLPEPPAEAGGTSADSPWIERFHRGGPAVCDLEPQLPLRPLVLEGLAQESRELLDPFVLIPADDPSRVVEARGLGQLLGDALESTRSAGRDPGPLARGLDSLQLIARQLVDITEPPGDLAALLNKAGDQLAHRLALPEDDDGALRDDLRALAAALPREARVLRLDAHTPLRLYCEVHRATRRPLQQRFDERLTALRENLRDLLQLDHMASDAGRSPEAVAASLGGAAADYFDPTALARTLPAQKGSAVLGDARRRRIEATLATLDEHLERGDTSADLVFLHAPGLELPLPGADRRLHPDPLAAAVGYYDGLARRHARLFRAVRLAELEIAGRYDAARHDEALANLDWQGFGAEEIALVPQLVVLTSGRRLRGREQGSLSELLRSSRPVHVLVNDEVGAADEAEDLSVFHLDLGHLVMAHREVFAVSSSLARPDRLTEGLVRMAGAPRPGVVFVRLPDRGLTHHYPLLTEAALRGRACPEFIYDPDGGASWADRFDFAGNPEPNGAWPVQSVRCLQGAEEQSLSLPFTFADAVALEPAYLPHLRVIAPSAWDDETQIPLADYLDRFDPEGRERWIPYIWLVGESGVAQRAVVTRELALTCRDRLRAWRVVQELAGYDNAYAERAAIAAREQALSEAAQEREQLELAHAEALASARGDGARESLEQLAAVLLSPGGLAVAAPVTRSAAAPAVAGEQTVETDVAAEPEPVEEEEEEVSFDEAYIDTPLCTSCNECTNINSRLFEYNADKQAFIGDPANGSFADLVKAAVLCPAHCIHPGKPRGDDSTATPELIEQAAKFN